MMGCVGGAGVWGNCCPDDFMLYLLEVLGEDQTMLGLGVKAD
jgi:hypothetical protein